MNCTHSADSVRGRVESSDTKQANAPLSLLGADIICLGIRVVAAREIDVDSNAGGSMTA